MRISTNKTLQVKAWRADELYNGDKNVIIFQLIGLYIVMLTGLNFLEILNSVRNIPPHKKF